MQRVLVDADVLFSATLRYWVMQCRVSMPSMFSILITEDILAEVLSKLRDKYPRWDGRQTSRVRQDILDVFDELVLDFDGTIDYTGVDEGDFHVHAAAVSSRANILLTCDRGLLNLSGTDALHYEAYHPDDFFVLLNDSGPLEVRDAVLAQLRHYASRNGARNTRLVDSLVEAGCPKFAQIVRGHLKDLSGAMSRSERRNLRRGEGFTLGQGEG